MMETAEYDQRLLTMTNNNETMTMPVNDDGDDGLPPLTPIDVVVIIGIFILMIGVGAQCEVSLLRKMIRSPKALKAALVGVTCQFGIMPMLSYALSKLFQQSGYTALGFVLAGCVPGGSASNVFTMWSHGIVELSVFMTIVSTICAFVMTPLWLFIFSKLIDGLDDGNGEDENGSSLAFGAIGQAFALLIIPLIIGIGLQWCGPSVRRVTKSLLGAVAICVFVGALVALTVQSPESITEAGPLVVIASAIFFPCGAAISYFITTVLKFEPALKRTIVMEIGLQNLSLSLVIGTLSVKSIEDREAGMPFIIWYAIFMFSYAFLFVMPFRWQRERNLKLGIVDNDPDFWVEEEQNDQQEQDKPPQDDEEEGNATTVNTTGADTNDDDDNDDEATPQDQSSCETTEDQEKQEEIMNA